MLAHVVGIPLEEWLMPFIVSAGGVLVGVRAMCSRRARTASEMIVELIDKTSDRSSP
jgi:hypothetical protein